MRFNDEGYLKDYLKGKFPVIHDDLFTLLSNRSRGDSFCDLCGNSGMLGQRIIDEMRSPCILVEGDPNAIAMANKYATSIPKYHLRVSKETYPELRRLFGLHKVDTLVARRCISELFTAPDDPDRILWADMLAEVGVREVFLQGRAPVKTATHPLPSVNEEIQIFLSRFKVHYQEKQLAYLRLL